MSLINVKVDLAANGRVVRVPGILDTGAHGFAYVDESVTRQLGVQLERGAQYYGVGGVPQVGWKSVVDQVGVAEVPECTIRGQIGITVGNLGIPNIQVLLGDKFMAASKINLDYAESDDNVRVKCPGGQGALVSTSEIPEGLIYGGIAAVVLIGVAFLLSD